MEALNNVVLAISDFLYQPFIVPLFLVVGGLYLSFRTKFVQARMIGESFRVISESPTSENGISSFGALMVSTASRVGTGNIIGVSTAICLGGAGAVFWMWLIAFLGSASAFVESTLAQIYKKRDTDGSSYGGPAYYILTALKQRWLGVIFALFVLLTYSVGYNLLASYNLQTTFQPFGFYNKATPFVVGIILAIFFGIIVIGGAKRLTKVTGVMVPVMGIMYVLVALIVMALNIKNIPHMFGMIFESAFDFEAIFGGFGGSCIMYGIKRGLYSNEAGMGSAPNAAATADVSHPVKQGLVQSLSVYLDTWLICTMTAFMCLCTDVVPSEANSGAPYVQESIGSTLGHFGPVFIAVAMSLFAFTTLIGNYSYCEGCLRFILKRNASPTELLIFRIFATVIVFVGAVLSASLVWSIAEVLQALMVIVNVPVIIILAKQAVDCLKDYEEQRKAGKNPVYNAKKCGIKAETDFWK